MNDADMPADVVAAAQTLIDEAQKIIDEGVAPSEDLNAAQALIDEAQKIIADEAAPDPVPAAPAETSPLPTEDSDIVEVEVSRAVTLNINGADVSLVPGKTGITRGLFATIKQTHQADAVRRG